MIQYNKERFNRSELLLGEDNMQRLATLRVILFGLGGVGSWCAECLVRSGVHHLTLVDSDLVCPSNCNRQLMATTRTLGSVKVDALRDRLLEINPDAEVQTMQRLYAKESADTFALETYDVIVDAIDSLQDKAHLILQATQLMRQHKHLSFYSSMGAALRIDPTRIRVAEFWQVQGDPLARALRNKFKREKSFPACKFTCVYSEEPILPNLGIPLDNDTAASFNKVQTNGSLCHITAIFGMTLAGLILKERGYAV